MTAQVIASIMTDGLGHYAFYGASGMYTIAIYQNNRLIQLLPDKSMFQFLFGWHGEQRILYADLCKALTTLKRTKTPNRLTR